MPLHQNPQIAQYLKILQIITENSTNDLYQYIAEILL